MKFLKISLYCLAIFLVFFTFACFKLPSVKVEQIYLTDFVVEGDVVKTKLNLVFINEDDVSFSFRIADVSATLDGKELPMEIEDGWQKVAGDAKSHVKLQASMNGQDVLQHSLQRGIANLFSNDPFVLQFDSNLYLKRGTLSTKINLKRTFQFTLNDVISNTKELR